MAEDELVVDAVLQFTGGEVRVLRLELRDQLQEPWPVRLVGVGGVVQHWAPAFPYLPGGLRGGGAGRGRGCGSGRLWGAGRRPGGRRRKRSCGRGGGRRRWGG